MSVLVPVATWYLSLLPVRIPEYYEQRQPLQRAQMEYDDECGPQGFHAFFKGRLRVEGKEVVDLGCGYGGRSVRYKELGAKSVIGIEVLPEMVEDGKAFAARKHQSLSFLLAAGESLPLPERSVDTICCYDVPEHVESVESCLREAYRVLRTGGSLFAVFPPFHHPTGGSHLHGWVSRSPLPNVLFPCKTLIAAAEEISQERGQRYRPPLQRPTDRLPSVNGTTLHEFRRILTQIPFRDKRCQCTALLSPQRRKWHSWHMRYYAAPFRFLTHLPILNEIFTDRIVAELNKISVGPIRFVAKRLSVCRRRRVNERQQDAKKLKQRRFSGPTGCEQPRLTSQ
jgi:SAM-dependent methyltransferase